MGKLDLQGAQPRIAVTVTEDGMIEIPLKRKYRVRGIVKNCGFNGDHQGVHRHRKNGPKTYDRTAHVLVMGPTGKTRMEHR